MGDLICLFGLSKPSFSTVKLSSLTLHCNFCSEFFTLPAPFEAEFFHPSYQKTLGPWPVVVKGSDYGQQAFGDGQ